MSAVTCPGSLLPAIRLGCNGREILAMPRPASFRWAISNQCQIVHRGPNIELPQNLVAAPTAGQFGHSAIGIVHVAKHDCLCRTRLLAGCLQITVAHGMTEPACLHFRLLNALDTERAFLHDT